MLRVFSGFAVALGLMIGSAAGAAEIEDYAGAWALTLPGGGVGWLGIDQEDGYYDGSIMWVGGSVVPLASVYMHDDTLVFTRLREVERKEGDEVVRTQTFTDWYVCTVDGDAMTIVEHKARNNGRGVVTREFMGTKNPPLPPAPDLSDVTFGEPIELFNGEDLTGWKLTNPNATNGWSAVEGVLVNNPVQKDGEPSVHYGNLRTVDEFEDFNLRMDVKVPEDGNSGVYLRGIYEVQVLDSYGEPADSHHMGAVYSRITPSTTAEKPAGEWQTLDITLVDRHITVKLNGSTIIDNAPLEGITGGALTADEFSPGPIYLQGDHTGVSYKNIVLRPVVE